MIEVPMLETLASFWLTEHLFGATWTPERGAMGYDRIINKYRHPFPTRDGYICVLVYNDKHWRSFFKLIGREEMFDSDRRFSTQEARSRNIAQVYEFVAGEMMLADTALKDYTSAVAVLDPGLPLLLAAGLVGLGWWSSRNRAEALARARS